MRDITYKATRAFMDGEPFKLANTEIVVRKEFEEEIVYMLLHGNEIAMRTPKGIYVSSAGWKTATTKERLNGIPGVHVQQKAGEWYLNGRKWENARDWTKIETEPQDWIE